MITDEELAEASATWTPAFPATPAPEYVGKIAALLSAVALRQARDQARGSEAR